MREAAIAGIGIVPFGWQVCMSLRELASAAAVAALDDAGLAAVDTLWVGCAQSGLLTGQEHLGPLIASHMGLGSIPSGRVESADASGALAVRAAWLDVASGQVEAALAIGVEKVTDVDDESLSDPLSATLDQEYEVERGASHAAVFAMMAREHMERHGTTPAQLAAIAEKNHTNAIHDEYAFNRRRVTRHEVLDSPMLADPLHTLDAATVCDGAAAVLVTTLERARKLRAAPWVRLAGIGVACERLAFHERDDWSVCRATRSAARRAYDAAGLTAGDIDVAEVHDVYTIAEVRATEALGFFAPGQGGPAAADGLTAIEGSRPINPSGGLLARGHPLAASGVAQIVLLGQQLRQQAGPIQVSHARNALAHCIGGTGASAVVTILSAEWNQP